MNKMIILSIVLLSGCASAELPLGCFEHTGCALGVDTSEKFEERALQDVKIAEEISESYANDELGRSFLTIFGSNIALDNARYYYKSGYYPMYYPMY